MRNFEADEGAKDERRALEEKVWAMEKKMEEKERQFTRETKAKVSKLEELLRKKEATFAREKESFKRTLETATKAAQQNAAKEALASRSQDMDKRHNRELQSLSQKLTAQQQAAEDEIAQHSQALEKRHSKEIQGLAKQIQYLRARCIREEGFRESLGYQKRFFLMMIEVYGEWYVFRLIIHKHTLTS
jgi:hypothetical protein